MRQVPLAPVYRSYLRKMMPGPYRPFRRDAINLAVHAFELRYGWLRVYRHRARLEAALGSVYASIYNATQEAA